MANTTRTLNNSDTKLENTINELERMVVSLPEFPIERWLGQDILDLLYQLEERNAEDDAENNGQ